MPIPVPSQNGEAEAPLWQADSERELTTVGEGQGGVSEFAPLSWIGGTRRTSTRIPHVNVRLGAVIALFLPSLGRKLARTF